MSPVTAAKPNKARPILRLKNPKRFLIQKEQRQKDRLNEDWTRSRLIDELYFCLMSIKEKDEEGFRGRKYEEQIRKEDLTVHEPIFASHEQKSKCVICQGFANIHCTNCSGNVWLCIDHWGLHGKGHES
jgi:hypothetical protein